MNCDNLISNWWKEMCHSEIMWCWKARLDYYNSVLSGHFKSALKCLQFMQKSAVRLLKGTRKSERVPLISTSLHWLLVKCRIEFQSLCYNIKLLEAPCFSHSILINLNWTEMFFICIQYIIWFVFISILALGVFIILIVHPEGLIRFWMDHKKFGLMFQLNDVLQDIFPSVVLSETSSENFCCCRLW